LVTKSLLVTAAKWVAGGLVGTVTLLQVIDKAGNPGCTAVVHVTECPAVVSVDGREQRVESPFESPVVFELSAGAHVLRLRQRDQVLDEQRFNLARGEEQILTTPLPATDRKSTLVKIR
jgi:hypothetical protein